MTETAPVSRRRSDCRGAGVGRMCGFPIGQAEANPWEVMQEARLPCEETRTENPNWWGYPKEFGQRNFALI